MLNKINISSRERLLIVYILLAMMALAVFWQVNQYDFVFDDSAYVPDNFHIQSGITSKGIRWAFTTRYMDLWNPLVWLSLMLDYQLFHLNAGGYHMTNLILHILSTLLLFFLFNRMTGAVWKSAFVAALFALHPLHVESVAWVAERKDVLSAFFWMLTLCFYVYYTEKQTVQRYLLVFCCFAFALMSKPMVVTIPVIMILIDYWPLRRFELKKGNVILWQLKEKSLFFILSAIVIIVTFYNPESLNTATEPDLKYFPLSSRVANATVSYIIYLGKTLWPHKMAVLYPFSTHIPVWQVTGASFLIIVFTIFIIILMKRLPYLFVGWFWYLITISPVIGIIQISLSTPYTMADRYHYLSSIGIAIILAWGVPLLFPNRDACKRILFPVTIALILIMVVLSWKQCGYWKNNILLFEHALQVTDDNYVAHNNLGLSLAVQDKLEAAIENYNKAIKINNQYYAAYINRGSAYATLRKYQHAIADYNKAISINENYFTAYYNRGNAYDNSHQYKNAIIDYSKTIYLKPDYADAYYNRANVYNKLAQYQSAIEDYSKSIQIRPGYSDAYSNRGNTYARLGQYSLAIADYNQSLSLNHNNLTAYYSRIHAYFNRGDNVSGCQDAQKACIRGECKMLEWAKNRGYCR